MIKTCKRYFEIEEIWLALYTIWNQLINYLGEGKYKPQLQEFKITHTENLLIIMLIYDWANGKHI